MKRIECDEIENDQKSFKAWSKKLKVSTAKSSNLSEALYTHHWDYISVVLISSPCFCLLKKWTKLLFNVCTSEATTFSHILDIYNLSMLYYWLFSSMLYYNSIALSWKNVIWTEKSHKKSNFSYFFTFFRFFLNFEGRFV